MLRWFLSSHPKLSRSEYFIVRTHTHSMKFLTHYYIVGKYSNNIYVIVKKIFLMKKCEHITKKKKLIVAEKEVARYYNIETKTLL